MRSADYKEIIEKAQSVQKKRLNKYGLRFNSQIPSGELDDMCLLGEEEQKLRQEIFEQYKMTARGMGKLLKVARTIADIAESDVVRSEHILEALSYRINDFFSGGESI